MQRRSSKQNGAEKKTTVLKKRRGPSLSLRGRRGGIPRSARKNVVNNHVADSRRDLSGFRKTPLRTPRRPVGQRAAQNLVKRAMLRNRRQAIAVRRPGNTVPVSSASTRRLVEQVRQWRNTAKLLHSALQIEASKNLRSPFGMMDRNSRTINNSLLRGSSRNSVQNRLGWQPSNKIRRGRNSNINPIPKPNNGRFGSMRSDDMSRESERIKRITADVVARYGNDRSSARRNDFRASVPSRRQNSFVNDSFTNNFRQTRRFRNENDMLPNFNNRVGLKNFRGNNRSRGYRMQYRN